MAALDTDETCYLAEHRQAEAPSLTSPGQLEETELMEEPAPHSHDGKDEAERDLRHAEVPPFFHMPVPTLMLITLLNDGTRITIEHHIAVAPRTPPKVEHALSALMQYQAAQHRDRHEDWWRERSAEVNLIDLRSRAPSSHVPELRNTRRAEWLGSAECYDRYCENQLH